MDYLEIKAPAKINIGLNVVSKRSDGFHNIETVFYPIFDLYDELFFEHHEDFLFTSNDSELETQHNLIVRAKELLEKESDKVLNVKIHLEKNIPIGAGMGGGSSDAAAALISLNEMFSLGFTEDKLREFALRLGSDIPFFIKPRPSFACSRGEILQQMDIDINDPILLINPGIHISTKEAYQNIKPAAAEFDLKTLRKSDFSDSSFLINNIKNDFEEYAFNTYPEIEQIKESMYKHGAKFSIMTGSGSTVFGIFPSLMEAEAAASSLNKSYFKFISYIEE